MIFEDREDAGEVLGTQLKQHVINAPVILALARGGVPVGLKVAQILKAPLEVLLVRKIGAPHNPELGIGAVAEGGITTFNEPALSSFSLSREKLMDIQKAKEEEIKEKIALYRGGKSLPQLTGKTAIIVDDGLATGITALAAIKAVKKLAPKIIIFAAPVGAPETIEQLQKKVDDIICNYTPTYLEAIGAFYNDFEQVSDDEVVRLLGAL